jgi:hypothetical protein
VDRNVNFHILKISNPAFQAVIMEGGGVKVIVRVDIWRFMKYSSANSTTQLAYCRYDTQFSILL